MKASQIIDIWQKIQTGDTPPDITIPQFIKESHKRSDSYGVDPFKRTNYHILDQKELQKRVEVNQKLLNITIPSMNDLYAITKEANFCIAIADHEGYILKRIGDEHQLEFTGYSNFVEGANWTEEKMGTNAVGLVLVHNKPCQVHAYEHYCKCACLSTCSAAPIHDTEGNLLGVLDLTGPYKHVNAHTLGLVVASARAIERSIKLDMMYNEVNSANMYKNTIMESISEGMIAVHNYGEVKLINDRACQMLDIDGDNYRNKNIKDLLPPNNYYFFSTILKGQKVYGETMLINTHKGKKKFLLNCTPIQNHEMKGSVVTLHELHQVVNKIIGAKTNITFDNLIGQSYEFKQAIEQAKMAAESNSSVLLLGESGVGKDLFAKSIHNASNRKNEAFFAINCAAIPRELISSELFGYNEGAFTGARKGGKPGAFELADQGTIFLDEIGEMPVDLQATLLRVVEEKTILRLGGREFIPINIRLISATNKDVQEEIKQGNFRNDLFYRLSVITIDIPPLRQRKSDIPLLVDHFVNSISSRFGKTIKKIDPEVMDILLNHNWPGNIRELSNTIERAINLTRNGILSADLLPKQMQGDHPRLSVWDQTITKNNMEEQLIRTYLIKFGNNKSRVAKAMNISRGSLYRKLAKYDIDPD